MRFQKATSFLYHKLRHAVATGNPPSPVLFLGPPGIGKTSITREVARVAREGGTVAGRDLAPIDENTIFVSKDLTSVLPEDLGGLPVVTGQNTDNPVTRHAAQEWFKPFCKPGTVGVLNLDDLTQATPANAIAARQILLERSINGNKLSDGVLVVVTGNRSKDGAGASTLPSHFRNAINIIEIEPDLDEWCQWFAKRGGDLVVPAFLRAKPDLFSTLPDKADAKGSYATPRTWAMTAADLPPAEAAGAVSEMVSGHVGEGSAVSFMAYRDLFAKLPPAADLLRDPKGIMPKPNEVIAQADRRIGVMISLGYEAARQQRDALVEYKGHQRDSHPSAVKPAEDLLRAVAWVCGENHEYARMGMSCYSEAGGSDACLRKAISKVVKTDPETKGFYENLIADIKG